MCKQPYLTTKQAIKLLAENNRLVVFKIKMPKVLFEGKYLPFINSTFHLGAVYGTLYKIDYEFNEEFGDYGLLYFEITSELKIIK